MTKAKHPPMAFIGTGIACHRRDGERGRKPAIGGPHFTITLAPPC